MKRFKQWIEREIDDSDLKRKYPAPKIKREMKRARSDGRYSGMLLLVSRPISLSFEDEKRKEKIERGRDTAGDQKGKKSEKKPVSRAKPGRGLFSELEKCCPIKFVYEPANSSHEMHKLREVLNYIYIV